MLNLTDTQRFHSEVHFAGTLRKFMFRVVLGITSVVSRGKRLLQIFNWQRLREGHFKTGIRVIVLTSRLFILF